jgi:hypothetical protein
VSVSELDAAWITSSEVNALRDGDADAEEKKKSAPPQSSVAAL